MNKLVIIISIILIVNSVLLFLNSIKTFKLQSKINLLKYWISSIDKDELMKSSSHDARYLEEAKKILEDI